MYSAEVRRDAAALMASGLSLRSISMSTGISRATLYDWREHPEINAEAHAACSRCAATQSLPEPRDDYAYLLGLYLGDGCISLAGARDKQVWKLRIMCADAWPGLIKECARAMGAVGPATRFVPSSRWAAQR
jgi:transposase-like protein